MTTEGRAGEVLGPDILSACDRLLGEIGRREHMFGWLRVPDAETDEWLTVDAYYPGNRVVVTCSSVHDALLSERVPAHGLRLLLLDPDENPNEIGDLLAELPPVERPTGQLSHRPSGPRESAVARAFASATAPRERPRSGRGRPAGVPDHPAAVAPGHPAADPAPPERFVAAGLVVGVLLVAVPCAEIYLGLTQALGVGHVLLGFGIALDASARVLGTVAASRAGHRSWILPCVVGGSPVVAMFALFQRSGPVSTDPAPLAGLLSLGAIAVLVLALLGRVLGL